MRFVAPRFARGFVGTRGASGSSSPVIGRRASRRPRDHLCRRDERRARRNNRSEKIFGALKSFNRRPSFAAAELFSRGLRRRLPAALVAARDGTRFATSVRGPASSQ
jgi:hypothetical protein